MLLKFFINFRVKSFLIIVSIVIGAFPRTPDKWRETSVDPISINIFKKFFIKEEFGDIRDKYLVGGKFKKIISIVRAFKYF